MSEDGLISSALVDDIYAAALGEQSWDTALQRLRQMTERRLVTLLSFEHSSQLASVNAAVGDDDEWADACQQSYASTYYLYDPAASVIGDWSAGRWYHDKVMVSEQHRARHIFYQEFMRPNELGGISGRFVHRGNGDSAFLSLVGPKGSEGLSDRQRGEVDAISSHISRSLRMQARLQQHQIRGHIAESALDTLATPVFLLDESRNLIYANPAANQMMRDEPILQFQNGRFSPTAYADDIRWRKACEEGGILLQRSSGQPLAMSLIPIPDCSTLNLSWHRRLTLMTASGPRSVEAKARQLRALFGLTVAEVDLAFLLCRDGLSPQECADYRDVSVATVRTQIKSIYLKTGATRAAQLSQLILQL